MRASEAVVLSAVMPLALAAPAAAQDGSEKALKRTPESAHKLLQGIVDLIPPAITFPVWSNGYPGEWFTNEAEGHHRQYQPGALTAVQKISDCEWRFTIRYRGSQKSDNAPIPSTGVELQKLIDWRMVATTASGYSDVQGQAAIIMRDRTRYVIGTELEESNRIAFAFEFLRQHCLPANDTGF